MKFLEIHFQGLPRSVQICTSIFAVSCTRIIMRIVNIYWILALHKSNCSDQRTLRNTTDKVLVCKFDILSFSLGLNK